ncbi:hypothetical protein ACOSZF_09180 [Cytobacillus firmus]|uniref:Uncharacterized protein n=1 Tax=Cytobacillus firmus TaxID=1399 RepID=A0A800NAC5_CYTFI|nr:hypothetical protein [Cytobacillus firmus]KAF0823450.1 hypothetical protein KIS1582_2715 [Cytobacillus firmus]MDD9310371.1 hypothetical protein [Cytobacillus firmus]MEC1891261.1 hypothetical protein [Cytobacillus firmus]MED1942432.1 hypothetical protein [Cytobacillus firmus]MED4451327.1 hypothetical protein [Cytobacillus firmus]
MRKISACHYCLLFTFFSTYFLYLLFGISTITAACLFSGITLSIINLIEDEMKAFRQEHNGRYRKK